ncbi:hypothetical protein Sjap_005012 [Stephania japonica]|uniref:Uncharacterized protein n=1 Tax=Stephania japonica TaxID=461633 RepID=A0AAP0K4M0_9MAGN
MSFVTINERLTRAFERTLTVNDLYLHLYMKNHDEVTFIDTRSTRFYLFIVDPCRLNSRADIKS